jgi:hypothetical protein
VAEPDRIARLKERFQQIADSQERERSEALANFTPPVYDEVYWEAMDKLDRMAMGKD